MMSGGARGTYLGTNRSAARIADWREVVREEGGGVVGLDVLVGLDALLDALRASEHNQKMSMKLGGGDSRRSGNQEAGIEGRRCTPWPWGRRRSRRHSLPTEMNGEEQHML